MHALANTDALLLLLLPETRPSSVTRLDLTLEFLIRNSLPRSHVSQLQ
jgi:hypothetical protein